MNHPSRSAARSFSSIATLLAALCAAAAANAQAQPPLAPPLTTAPPSPPAPAAASSQPTPPSAPPPEARVEPPAPAIVTPPANSTQRPDKKWYDRIKLGGFVDAYANVNYNGPKPQSGQNTGRAFDTNNGFSLHWAGVNASYDPEPIGGTLSLRFGPGAYLYNGSYDAAFGAAFVKQAFVSWKPGGGIVTLDFGKFDTWIGAEVADSQLNMNYTRSFLFSGQSLFHTGLRADFALSDAFDLKLFAVNGWNNTVDNNAGKTVGASITLVPAKEFTASVNWIGGPEQADTATSVTTGELTAVDGANSRWRHLVDLVLDLHPESFHAILNADLGNDAMPTAGTGSKGTTWYGGNLTLGYAFSDMFSAAVRGGYFKDPDGWAMSQIVGVAAAAGHDSDWIDGTLTLAVTPTPNLIIKLDGRVDHANIDQVEGVFPKSPGSAPSKTLVTTTLGIVATTN